MADNFRDRARALAIEKNDECSVVCLPCQVVAPRQPSKRAANLLAVGHLREAHGSLGTVTVR